MNNANYMEEMNAYDQRQLEEYQKNRELVETCKTALEEEQEVLQQAKAEVEKEEAGLETLISQKEQQITAFQGDISNKEAALKEYEADIAAQNSTIAALEAAAAAERKQLEELNKPKVTYDGGMFQLPLTSYKRISDDMVTACILLWECRNSITAWILPRPAGRLFWRPTAGR